MHFPWRAFPVAPEKNKKIVVVETSLPTIRLSSDCSVTLFIVPSNTNYDLSLSLSLSLN
jgi:hypothetical protein